MICSLYATLNNRIRWCHQLTLTEEAQLEIEFWHSSFNGQHIWPRTSAFRVVYSDAGYGEYAVEHSNLNTNGQWSPDEVAKSSTWPEQRQ